VLLLLAHGAIGPWQPWLHTPLSLLSPLLPPELRVPDSLLACAGTAAAAAGAAVGTDMGGTRGGAGGAGAEAAGFAAGIRALNVSPGLSPVGSLAAY